MPLLPKTETQHQGSWWNYWTANEVADPQDLTGYSLLSGGIGPVQGFIATARRTQDLWFSSWMLSYLTCAALIEVVEATGAPNCVVLPCLRGNPLIQRWLEDVGVLTEGGPSGLSVASLPAQFLLLVKEDQLDQVGEALQDGVKGAWDGLWQGTREGLGRALGLTPDKEWELLWEAQARDAVELTWAAYPFRPTLVKEYAELVGEGPELNRAQGLGAPDPNDLYSLLYALTVRCLGARKSLRLLSPSTSQLSEACSLCGERPALATTSASDLWPRMARQFPRSLRSGGKERLCAVCTTKRMATDHAVGGVLGAAGRFPSTASIATSPFKAAVLGRLGDLQPKVQEYVDNVKQAIAECGLSWTLASPQVEGLSRLPIMDSAFLGVDGEWLLKESFQPEKVAWAYDLSLEANATVLLERAQEALKSLIEAAAELKPVGIPRPTPYLAILASDGNRMGEYLRGRVSDAIRGLTGHRHLSAALGDYSLRAVPRVVQGHPEGPARLGRLVYAGGDDVLAMLPVADLPAVLEELSLLFSGLSGTGADGWFEAQNGTVDTCEEAWKALDPSASIRVGVAIVHEQDPLGAGLEAARQAEAAAKDVPGMNTPGSGAFCIAVVHRSGDAYQAHVPFALGNLRGAGFFKSLVHAFTGPDRVLSPRLPGLLERSRDLVLDKDLAIAVAHSQARRQCAPGKADDLETILEGLTALIGDGSTSTDGPLDAWSNVVNTLRAANAVAREVGL